MRNARSPRSLTALAAGVAVVAELGLGALSHIAPWMIYPIALATGGIVVWIALAIDVVNRRYARPDPKDIAAIRALLRSNAATLEDHQRRLARADAHFQLLDSQPALKAAERDLCRAAARIETWDAIADEIPAWDAAVARWSQIVAGLSEEFAIDQRPASTMELKAARSRLPPMQNFSSPDLKLALAYLVQRERITSIDNLLESYCKSLSRGNLPTEVENQSVQPSSVASLPPSTVP